MNTIVRFFENLFCPPRCISCRGFLQKNILDPSDRVLCDRCRLAWEREKGEQCPDCGLEYLFCRCATKRMRDMNVSEAIKLVSYRKDKMTAGRWSILYMKKHANHRAFDFFAEQLSYPLKQYMEQNQIQAEDARLCYVPRGKKNRRVWGFDQSEQLCRRVSALCNVEALPVFYRISKRDLEQKKLAGVERVQNAVGHFAVDPGITEELQTVKCLFLLDDVITTGSSICGCVSPLRNYYGGAVVGVAIAQTPQGRRKSTKSM